TCRARYACPSGPATASALAMLDATTFSQWLCAEIALDAMSKMRSRDIVSPPSSFAADRREHRAHAPVDEPQRRLVAHRVVREVRALTVQVDGVSVQGRLFRHPVLEARA